LGLIVQLASLKRERSGVDNYPDNLMMSRKMKPHFKLGQRIIDRINFCLFFDLLLSSKTKIHENIRQRCNLTNYVLENF